MVSSNVVFISVLLLAPSFVAAVTFWLNASMRSCSGFRSASNRSLSAAFRCSLLSESICAAIVRISSCISFLLVSICFCISLSSFWLCSRSAFTLSETFFCAASNWLFATARSADSFCAVVATWLRVHRKARSAPRNKPEKK